MREVLLVRFGEVHLKGANRPYFLRMLTDNVRHSVKDLGARVWFSDSRIYVAEVEDIAEAAERVRRVFGVYSVSPALETEKDFEQIAGAALTMLAGKTGTFKVFARRSDKSFPVCSNDMAAEIGHRALEANAGLRVDVHKPEIRLHVEVREKCAYICCEEIMGVGGMPIGTGGRAALLLSGGIDSPVAGYSIMRRGVKIEAIHFESPPYTGERAKEKVLALAKKLGAFQGGMRVCVVPFTRIQLEIHDKCPEELGTVLMRRFMMRIAERLAVQLRAQALVTGENIGQVASQTMDAIVCTDMVVHMPVFRPLIGFDKIDIIREAEKIDTYETSILPYEDCCTVFTPRHPNTRPKPPMLEKAEALLDVAALEDEAVAQTRMIEV